MKTASASADASRANTALAATSGYEMGETLSWSTARAVTANCDAGLMHWTAVGVFLVGLGALLGAAPRLVRAPAPELGVSFETLTARGDRIRAAVETTSVVLLAAGSVVLALVELARWWFELAVVALALLCVWAIAAHKLRQLWELRENTAQDYAGANPRLASAEEQRTIARNRVRWDFCLRHAFTRTDDWPPAAAAKPCSVARDGPPATPPSVAGSFDSARLVPRHISELHERDTQLADLAIPSSIRADVQRIRAQGFRVDLVGDAVLVAGPDGRTAQVQRSSLENNPFGGLLARQRFVEDCEAIGVQVRRGPKGQPRPVGAMKSSPVDRDQVGGSEDMS